MCARHNNFKFNLCYGDGDGDVYFKYQMIFLAELRHIDQMLE